MGDAIDERVTQFSVDWMLSERETEARVVEAALSGIRETIDECEDEDYVAPNNLLGKHQPRKQAARRWPVIALALVLGLLGRPWDAVALELDPLVSLAGHGAEVCVSIGAHGRGAEVVSAAMLHQAVFLRGKGPEAHISPEFERELSGERLGKPRYGDVLRHICPGHPVLVRSIADDGGRPRSIESPRCFFGHRLEPRLSDLEIRVRRDIESRRLSPVSDPEAESDIDSATARRGCFGDLRSEIRSPVEEYFEVGGSAHHHRAPGEVKTLARLLLTLHGKVNREPESGSGGEARDDAQEKRGKVPFFGTGALRLSFCVWGLGTVVAALFLVRIFTHGFSIRRLAVGLAIWFASAIQVVFVGSWFIAGR